MHLLCVYPPVAVEIWQRSSAKVIMHLHAAAGASTQKWVLCLSHIETIKSF